MTEDDPKPTAPAGAAGAGDPPDPTKPPGIIARFWEAVKARNKKEQERQRDVARAVGRGVTGAAIGTLQTIAEGAAFVDRKTGLGEAIEPGFNLAYDEGGGARGIAQGAVAEEKALQEEYLGKRSDDMVAQFVEDATQFMTGYLALGAVRVVQGGVQLSKAGYAASALARGAVVDATAFDPYEAQFAEFVARIDRGWLFRPGLQELGDLLSVEGDDSAIVARMKRAGAGAILGTTFDGLVAVGRALNARRTLARPNLKPAEKAAAEVKLAEAEEVLLAIDEGVSTPNAPIVVRANPDETATLMMHGEEGPTLPSRAEAQAQANSMNSALDTPPEAPKAEPKTQVSPPMLASEIRTRLQGAVDAAGEVSDDVMDELAADILGRLGPDEATDVLTQLSTDATIQSAVNKMAQAHSRNLGTKIANLDVVLEYRPHDPAVREAAVARVQELLNFEDKRKWIVGEQGRALRLEGTKEGRLSKAEKRIDQDPDVPLPVRQQVREMWDVADAQRAIDELDESIGDPPVVRNPTDTDAVNANEFSLARARKAAEAVLKKLQAGERFFAHDPELAVQRADEIAESAEAQRTDPITTTPEQRAAAGEVKTSTSNPIEELSRWMDRVDDELEYIKNPPPARPARAHGQKLPEEVSPVLQQIRRAKMGQKKLNELRAILKRANAQLDNSLKARAERVPPEHRQRLYDEVSPISERLKRGTPEALLQAEKNKARTTKVAGMEPRFAGQLAVDDANIRQITRMFRMAGGTPADVTAAIQATNVIQKTGKVQGVLEFFVNALLSNPATVKTVVTSGAGITTFEALARVGAGLRTGNRALSQEGADILYGTITHLSENFRMARRALNEGQSVINPAPAHHAIGGTTGQVIRAPGAVIMAGDEFTRVTNYRAYVRAKSLRQGREWGLSGEKLQAHVDADLQAAFDPQTGIATIPEALIYAERSTLSGPLGIETVAGGFASYVKDNPGLQFLMPFLKAGFNIYRFFEANTPGLSRFNKEARAIMEAGGEEAAVLRTKHMMTGAVYTAGALLAISGKITGDAPGDPAVRDLWLKNHQPYSIKVGDTWVSYRRTDPLGIMLGLTADIVQFNAQMDEVDPDMEQFALAMISAGVTSVLAPTYMQGLSDFLDAVADGSPTAVERWAKKQAASFVPSGLNAVNTDPYFREARSFGDAIRNRIPGLSQTLDPRYDMFGQPLLNGGVGNRSALFKLKDGAWAVEQELMELGKGFAPFPSKTPQGVDMTDRETFDNGTGVSPYRRLMDLIGAEDSDGKTLRQRVEEEVRSERYQNASPGTVMFPGGRRWDLVARHRQRAFERAFRQVLSEYPLLKQENRLLQRQGRAAYRGGEGAVHEVEEMFGTAQQERKLRPSRIQSR